MRIWTRKISVKVGTVPWGACRVRAAREPQVGDVVWVQKGDSVWNKYHMCRVYEIIDGYYKLLYACDYPPNWA